MEFSFDDGARVPKKTGAGFGWFNSMVDAIHDGAIKPVWSRSVGKIHVDLSRPLSSAEPPSSSTASYSRRSSPFGQQPNSLGEIFLQGLSLGGVPAFLRRRQPAPRRAGTSLDTSDTVSDLSGGRIKIARHILVGASPTSDASASASTKSGDLSDASPAEWGGARSAGTATATASSSDRASPAVGESRSGGAPRPARGVERPGSGGGAGDGEEKAHWYMQGGHFLWRNHAPLDFGLGLSYSLDTRRVEPVMRIRLGDFVKVKAFPEPSVVLQGAWRIPGTIYGAKTAPLAMHVRYACPLSAISDPLQAPASLNVTLNYEMGSGIFLTPGSVETNWTVGRPNGAKLRVAGGVRFPRKLPLEEGEAPMQYEVRQLGLEMPW